MSEMQTVNSHDGVSSNSATKYQWASDDLEMSKTPTVGDNHNQVTDDLNRSLSTRQINMIAIAGVIGTGLYLGTGKALANGGHYRC